MAHWNSDTGVFHTSASLCMGPCNFPEESITVYLCINRYYKLVHVIKACSGYFTLYVVVIPKNCACTLDQFVFWLSTASVEKLSSNDKHHNRLLRCWGWPGGVRNMCIMITYTNLKSLVASFSHTESVQSQRLVTNIQILVVQFIHKLSILQFTRCCNVVRSYQKLTSVASQGAIHVRRTLCFWTSVALVAQSCIVHNESLSVSHVRWINFSTYICIITSCCLPVHSWHRLRESPHRSMTVGCLRISRY